MTWFTQSNQSESKTLGLKPLLFDHSEENITRWCFSSISLLMAIIESEYLKKVDFFLLEICRTFYFSKVYGEKKINMLLFFQVWIAWNELPWTVCYSSFFMAIDARNVFRCGRSTMWLSLWGIEGQSSTSPLHPFFHFNWNLHRQLSLVNTSRHMSRCVHIY